MDPEKQKQIDDAIALLKGEKYVVRSEADEKTYLKNYSGDAVNEKVKELFTTFHETIKEASGVEGKDNEKATDYAKRAFETKNELLTQASTELKQYKDEQINKDDTLKQLNTQLKGVKEELKSAKAETEQIKTDFKQEKFNSLLKVTIDSAVDSFKGKFKKMDERVLQNNIAAEVAKFKAKYTAKELDGAIVFYEGDKPVLDPDNGNMKGAAALIGEQLEYLIDEGQHKTGTGAKGSGGNGKDLTIPENVKTKSDLVEYLVKEQKMDSNSDEFMDAYDKYGE
ncbi:MAG: hypothetical protein ACYTDW_20580, partial [Planctomycetota bacterium]